MNLFRLSLFNCALLVPLVLTPARASETFTQDNPFAQPSTLPFQAPPFDRIKDNDYAPAFEEAMKEGLADFARIANATSTPTFENTFVTIEKAGRMLDRVQNAFNAVTGANTDDTLEKIEQDMAPKLAAYTDAIYLDPKLFARVKYIYDRRQSLRLDPESLQLVEVTYREFVHAGANLGKADQAKLKDLNGRISTLETTFQQKLLHATKAGALVVDDRKALAGLNDADIAAAAHAGESRGLKGKYAIPLQNTTQQPDLALLTDRDTRQKLFENSWTRAEKGDANDTRETIATLAFLRAQKAKLFGYPDFATYRLYDQMAKTPETVDDFMAKMIPATAVEAESEAKAIEDQIAKSGQHFALKPWDWEYYSEKVRKAQYDLDEDAVKPYFELDNVLKNGLFYAANSLYGTTFKERKDIPVWHPDVRVFGVFNTDGSELGLIYFDYFKRDNKQGGAWMSTFMPESRLLGTKAVVYNVTNFPKPEPGKPALLTFDEVTGMFHEFGHGLHALFATEKYPSLSGTKVARDFVEFPSQFNEHWALYPDVLRHYAVDCRTGKPMPAELVEKIKRAATFNEGYELGELLAAAELDMKWHGLSADQPEESVDQFESQALKAAHVDFADVPTRYRSSYFAHIWSNGYPAGYYAYLWTEMLDDDAFSWFTQHGGMTRANGERFRDMILSRGHTEDYAKMFRDFYGKDPEIGPMLEHRGLAKPSM
jgi:peptidyl-dipeptidase Dcp